MKKKYILFAVFTATAVMLSGCSKKTATEPEAEAQVTETGAETTESSAASSGNIDVSNLKTTTLADVDLDKLVQLGEYKGITVDVTKKEVTDADVEDSLKSNYSANPLMTEITDRAVQNGDTANIDFAGRHADTNEYFEGGTSQGYDLKIGSGSFIDGFEDGLVGVKVGETVDLNLTFPENYGSQELAGKDVIFTVTVNSIKSAAEEPTDEWAAGLGIENVKTLDDYRAHLKEELEKDAEDQYKQEFKNAAVSQVVDASTVDNMPEELKNRYFVMVYDSVSSYVQQMKMSYGVEMTPEEYVNSIMQNNGVTGTAEDYLRDIADQQTKRCMVLQAIADKEGIEVPQETIDQYIQEDYDSYFYQSYDTIDDYKASIISEDYREQIMAEKVADFIIENAANGQ
jgi:trigger factor